MHLQRCAMALTQRSVVCAVLATVATALIAITPVNGGPSTIQRVVAAPKASTPPACTDLHDDWVGTLPYFELQLSVDNGNALGCGESDASLYDEKDSLAISEHALTYINNRTLHVIRGTNAADLQSCHEIATIDLLAEGVFVEYPSVDGYHYDNRHSIYEATSMVAASQSDENDTSVWNHTVVIGFDRAWYIDTITGQTPYAGLVVVVNLTHAGSYEIQTIEYPDLSDLQSVDPKPLFGNAVAISANGLVLAVGAPQWNLTTSNYLGEVFVYERQSIDADFPDQPTRRLTDSVENRLYGQSLALSDDGQYLVVGAGGIDLAADKNLHYAELVDLTAGHTVELVAYDKDEMPGSARNFGTQVAIDDGLIAVAAPRDSRDNNVDHDGGSIYLFKLDENGAVEALEPKLYQCSGETDCGQASDADGDLLGKRWLQLARYGKTGRLVIADDRNNSPKAVFYSRRGDFGDTKSLVINTIRQKKDALVGANTKNLFGLSRDLTLAMVLGHGQESVLVVSDELPAALDLAPSSECVGDHNNDGLVNVTDLLKVIGAWGDCRGTCGDPLECTADTNNDGIINVLDKLKVIENWGVCQ